LSIEALKQIDAADSTVRPSALDVSQITEFDQIVGVLSDVEEDGDSGNLEDHFEENPSLQLMYLHDLHLVSESPIVSALSVAPQQIVQIGNATVVASESENWTVRIRVC
jgi:hypothetical protein